jgi:hypothetical protein
MATSKVNSGATVNCSKKTALIILLLSCLISVNCQNEAITKANFEMIQKAEMGAL